MKSYVNILSRNFTFKGEKDRKLDGGHDDNRFSWFQIEIMKDNAYSFGGFC